jgi:hypothetical protein
LTDDRKLRFGYVLGSVFYFGSLLFAAFEREWRTLALSICLLGGAAGWAAGILGTPLDDDERTRFSDIGKVFLTLGSAYALAKLETDIVSVIRLQLTQHPREIVMAASLFSTCFLVGLLFTLVTRLYGESEVGRRQRKVATLVAKADEIIKSLTTLRDHHEIQE